MVEADLYNQFDLSFGTGSDSVMENEAGSRHYSTGEIALLMLIVFLFLTIPTLVGFAYFWFYM